MKTLVNIGEGSNNPTPLTVSGNHFLTVHQGTFVGARIEVRETIQFEEPSVNRTHFLQRAFLRKGVITYLRYP